jgi:hypothetical protein
MSGCNTNKSPLVRIRVYVVDKQHLTAAKKNPRAAVAQSENPRKMPLTAPKCLI